jgi:predicted nucleotidyltransferase
MKDLRFKPECGERCSRSIPPANSAQNGSARLHDPLQQALAPFADRISTAFVYGSIARGTDTSRSDIHLMIVSDELSYSDLFNGLQAAEQVLARAVNPTVMNTADWEKRVQKKSPFVKNPAATQDVHHRFRIGTWRMSRELENLAKFGRLKREDFAQAEFDGLKKMAQRKLVDSRNESLSDESRFDLAYNASQTAAANASLQYMPVCAADVTWTICAQTPRPR